ncbi:hypothetical protein EASAB2608_06175 [Streptomyces sp. EAS-AB2608]|uniref:hypothetical protein n=1 Tax=unclassified Streptomyces TaxID=2593676 RepID=UPI001671CC87|nr:MULTISPECIES: hypothetical protein [unclassified Streptomyces]BCM70841.1 hypothetical protein EASAB2608_06175 [Streptomyces sp. EAS-AB2608]
MPSDTASANAFALLPLPEVSALSQNQVRGITCVFDGVGLSPGSAVDLGERSLRRVGGRVSWFPRACRPCALRWAMDTLVDHSRLCEQCVDDSSLCPEGAGFVRAVREARRGSVLAPDSGA